jgi:hypothetical protein
VENSTGGYVKNNDFGIVGGPGAGNMFGMNQKVSLNLGYEAYCITMTSTLSP